MFGAAKKQSGFTPYSGDGFKVDIPSKWNPSKEKEFPGTVLRYEDNFDATNNLFVSITPAAKGKISDYGSPEKFLDEVCTAPAFIASTVLEAVLVFFHFMLNLSRVVLEMEVV